MVGKHLARQDIFDKMKMDNRTTDYMDETCQMVEFGISCVKITYSATYQSHSYFTHHLCLTEYHKF